MKKITVYAKNHKVKQMHEGDAGFDIRAYLTEKESVIIRQGEVTLVSTGLYIDMPSNYEMQIRSRSGLTLKHGVVVANSPGTVDSGYVGEIKVLLTKITPGEFIVEDGMRIAQVIFSKYEPAQLDVKVYEKKLISKDKRGDKGFGSTGI